MNNSIGKYIRLKRIFNEASGNVVLVPLDHGVTSGPIEGLKNMRDTVKHFAGGGVDGLILHKGIVTKTFYALERNTSLLVHLSASTEISPDTNLKTLVCTVEEGLQLGADGVSIHVNLGSDNEAKMLSDFGAISKKCSDWGVPLLAMMYARGENIRSDNVANIRLAARVACELGADLVKVSFTGSADSFRSVVEGCSIPVIVAGGEKASNTETVLKNISMALEAGARGVACGRNTFQHINPPGFCKAISAIVHNSASVEEALEIVKADVPLGQAV